MQSSQIVHGVFSRCQTQPSSLTAEFNRLNHPMRTAEFGDLTLERLTAVFTFVEKKVASFLNCASTAVSFLLALRVTPCVHGHDAHMGATLAID